MKKRVISLVLALCLVLSLVPASVFASDKSGIYIEYDIMSRADRSSTELKFANLINYDTTNNFVAYAADSRNDGIKNYYMRYNAYNTIEIYKNQWFILKINVPKAGTYDVKIKNHASAKGHLLDAYIFPASVTPNASALTEGNYIGTVDCNNSTGKDGKTNPNPFMKDGAAASYTFPTAGEYYIGFKSSAGETSGTEYGYLGNIILDGGSEKAYMGKYELPEEPFSVMQTKTRDISVSVLLSDNTWGKADISNCAIENESIATVTDNGKVSGVALGETTVSFDVSYAGEAVGSFRLPVNVVENDGITIKYDFAKLYGNISADIHNKTFGSSITYDSTDGFFKYANDSRNDVTPKTWHLRWSSGMFEIYQNQWIFFEIDVPRAGDYDISMYNGKALLGGEVSVYVIESDGEKPVAADFTDTNLVGTIDCEDTSLAEKKVVKVETPTFVGKHYFETAGKYYIGFRALDTTPDANDTAYVGDIVMRAGDKRIVMNAYPKNETVSLVQGQEAKVSAYALLSDVSEVELACSDFQIADGGEDIVSVSDDGVVTALSEGETTVSYTASYGNSYETSFETKIKVTAGGISITYDIESDMNRMGWDSINKLGDLKKLTDDKTRGFYRFFGATSDTAYKGGFLYMNNFILSCLGRYVALEVYVPQGGIYDLTVNHAASSDSYMVDVFVNKTKASTNEDDYVGSYDCHDEATTNRFQPAAAPSYVGKVVIPERGYYVLTFMPTDGTGVAQSWKFGSIGTFTLKSGNEAVLAGVYPGATASENEMFIISVDSNELVMTDPENPTTMQIKTEIVPATDGADVTKKVESTQFGSSANRVASVSDDGVITAAMEGSANITVKATVDGEACTATLPVAVKDDTGVVEGSAELLSDDGLFLNELASTSFTVRMNSGHTIEIPSGDISYSYEPEGIVSVDETGMVKGLSVGETTVTAKVENFRGADVITASKKITVTEHEGKKDSTYYTAEKRANVKRNAERYDWAKSEVKATVAKADIYLENWEKWYSLMVPNGIPSSFTPTYRNDPGWYICHYCGVDLAGDSQTSGHSAYSINPIQNPWKVQCNNCKRFFPSNDFALLYERGRDAEGHYDVNRAIAANAEAVANGERDALKNVLYPEVGEIKTINYNQGLRPGETVETWGVDDGFGYRPTKPDGTPYISKDPNTSSDFREIKLYVAHYLYQFWNESQTVATTLANAYVYTGEKKYGRAGAAIVDRWADTYHQFDLSDYDNYHGQGLGYANGHIGECAIFENWSLASDAVFPMIYDSQTINFLKGKAEEFGLSNDKSSSTEIWENWKNNILIETWEGAKVGKVQGNFGFSQAATTAAAIVLAEEPMRTEIIDWTMSSGRENEGDYQGGNVLKNIVNNMDRDGVANEVGLNYNSYQMKALERVADYLLVYAKDGKRNYNLFDFPKYAKMFEPWNGLTLVDVMHPNLGDGGSIGSTGFFGAGEVMITNFMSVYALQNPDTETLLREIAQFIYRWKGYKLDEIRTSIFDAEPEAVQDILKDYISGEQPLTRSDILPGYGFTVLRDGTKYNSASAQSKINTQRSFWMWYGPTIAAHSHKDALRIGIEAFGFSIAPDQGYSANSGKFPQRLQFDTETIAGNTVVINGNSQEKFAEGATPYHYDDSGIVKLMDAEALGGYKTIVDDLEHYRRTLVMVKVDEENSYGVDFFRVKGGESHMFSFFSSAEHLNAVDGLGECTPQVDENGEYIGSLAGMGPDGKGAPYTDPSTGETKYFVGPGQDPNTADAWYYDTIFPRGFSWLGKVRKYNTPSDIFSVEFDIEDYRRVVENNKGIKLRLTQMNDFTPDEVTFAAGPKIDKPDNAMMPKTFDYLLVTNKKQAGEGTLDLLYTTVYEPYQHDRYLKAIEPISTISVVDGNEAENDVVRAVKVTHEKDRTDYIIYATNNEVTYKLTDGDREIYFKGFVGLYSVNSAGEVLYRYVNDGTVIGENTPSTEKAAYTGTVRDFDMTFDFGDFDNWIDVNIDCENPAELAGKVIYIENDGVQNGAYEIVDAWKNEDGSVRLDLGTASLVRSYIDEYDIDAGYVYNIDVKQNFRIPLAYIDASLPEFEPVEKMSTSVGSMLKTKITATSPLDREITYSGTKIPRGASIDEETGELTWNPTSNQTGDNHFEITATDSDGRENAIHFIVSVYGATTGGGVSAPTTPEVPSTPDVPTTPPTSSGNSGAGGGGGGAAPAPGTPEVPETPSTPEIPTTPDVDSNVRFIDLGNHLWAQDAINALADEGIIKGTSENTFSPAANITRADFAILLVRAFRLASDNEENFADVEVSDYFAKELAVARNTGLVNGIGENKFAPRNNITRQDMMVIVYRALKSLPLEVAERERSVGAAMNDSPVDYQNRDVTEPQRDKVSAELTDEVSYLDVPQASDFDQVSDYAREAVSFLVNAGLINGKNGLIAPTDYTTRAEIAVLLKRILDYTGK